MEVDAVTELIESECIFQQDDNLLLKRIANAETEYGTTGDLNLGGIWQVMNCSYSIHFLWVFILLSIKNVTKAFQPFKLKRNSF